LLKAECPIAVLAINSPGKRKERRGKGTQEKKKGGGGAGGSGLGTLRNFVEVKPSI